MAKPFGSLEKACNILLAFDHEQEDFSAQEISENLGLPLSTTYRYLEFLVSKGFLARDGERKKYFLGLAIYRLGNLPSAKRELIEMARPHMKALSELFQETVILTIISGWDAVCLERIETHHLIKLSLERGSCLPLHAGASSKILLAYQDESFIEALYRNRGLPKLTENTITDLTRLKAHLRVIRRQGYAYSDAEADQGARAVSVPVLSGQGKILAGLSLAGPQMRLTEDKVIKVIEKLKGAASQISLSLRGRPEPGPEISGDEFA
ncbi:MAG: IclR family transcriptional regulator [Thermodesulfobacteriota bacterium]